MEYSDEELSRARGHILELLEGIAGGSFEVTRHPHAALCADCPARDRLCSHARADLLRESPDPAVEPRGRENGDHDESSEQGGAEPQLSLLEGQ